MATPMIRVRALGDGTLPHVDESSRGTKRARAVGRDAKGVPCPELVADVAYYRRSIRRGELEIVSLEEPTESPAAPSSVGDIH